MKEQETRDRLAAKLSQRASQMSNKKQSEGFGSPNQVTETTLTRQDSIVKMEQAVFNFVVNRSYT